MGRLLGPSGLLLALAGALTGALMLFEEQLIYFPQPDLVGNPSQIGLAYEEVRFGPEGRLHGWFIPGSGQTTLLWLHGNAGNISHRLPWITRLRTALPGHLFIFDYQGYGSSAGRPNEENTYADARAALDYLHSRRDVDPERIIFFGESLGGAVAVQLATERPPRCLVTLAAFTSIADLARLHYPLIPLGLIRTRYDSLEKIGQARTPILVTHGERDSVVPVEHAQRLFASASEPRALQLVARADHNDVFEVGGAAYLQAIQRFCQRFD